MEVIMRCYLTLLPALLLTVIISPLHATIIHVPGDSTTIQGGINGAIDGDTVMVAPGTYHEHDIDFFGKAITVMSTDPEDSAVVASTIVDGDSLGVIFYFHSNEDTFCVLAGLTITGGSNNYGGGISCESSSPTIIFNNLTGNSAIQYGGGIYLWDSDPIITNNTITENRADRGGGILCSHYSYPKIENNVIEGNVGVRYGGGIYNAQSSPSIIHNIISGNSTDQSSGIHGGGIYCEGSISPIIYNNIITDNFASARGGGIYCGSHNESNISYNYISRNMASSGGGIFCDYDTYSSISNNVIMGNYAGRTGGGIRCSTGSASIISSNIVASNLADQNGGGIYIYDNSTPTINNNTISGNQANVSGGGIYCHWSSPLITNNTVTRNNANFNGGGFLCRNFSFPTIDNSIFWENNASMGREIYIGITSWPSTLTISYSDIKGGQDSVYIEDGCTLIWGDGMIDENPNFMSFHGFDYLLRRFSPCIDTGDPALDDGFEWPKGYFNGPRSDMGAYGGPGNVGWLPQ
jgi:parallel beta-helix repeat protein